MMAQKNWQAEYYSPLGTLKLHSNEEAITGLEFAEEGQQKHQELFLFSEVEDNQERPAILDQCARELDEYFLGSRKAFSVELLPEGTEFQRQVWEQLRAIPYGETASYKEIAIAIGNPRAARAVGNANNSNPIGILIPCHRVIGSDGKLTGYAGGLWRKKWLLDHEGDVLEGTGQLFDRDDHNWIYILRLENDNLYTGYTNNLVRRFAQHRSGKGGARITRGLKPEEIVMCWRVFSNKSNTMRIEYYIKQQNRETKLKMVTEPLLLGKMLLEDLGIRVKLYPFPPEIIHAFIDRWEDENLHLLEQDPFAGWPAGDI